MQLSRVKINTTKKKNTIKFLSSPQVIHASVEGCFADADTTRKLWRLDYFPKLQVQVEQNFNS